MAPVALSGVVSVSSVFSPLARDISKSALQAGPTQASFFFASGRTWLISSSADVPKKSICARAVGHQKDYPSDDQLPRQDLHWDNQEYQEQVLEGDRYLKDPAYGNQNYQPPADYAPPTPTDSQQQATYNYPPYSQQEQTYYYPPYSQQQPSYNYPPYDSSSLQQAGYNPSLATSPMQTMQNPSYLSNQQSYNPPYNGSPQYPSYGPYIESQQQPYYPAHMESSMSNQPPYTSIQQNNLTAQQAAFTSSDQQSSHNFSVQSQSSGQSQQVPVEKSNTAFQPPSVNNAPTAPASPPPKKESSYVSVQDYSSYRITTPIRTRPVNLEAKMRMRQYRRQAMQQRRAAEYELEQKTFELDKSTVYPPGHPDTVQGVVKEICSVGYVLTLPNGREGFLAASQLGCSGGSVLLTRLFPIGSEIPVRAEVVPTGGRDRCFCKPASECTSSLF